MKISTKRVLKQLKDDLTGKDSHTGITLSYAWLANQYGHISLGFIPSFLLFHFFKINAVKSAIYISLVWLVFEIYNFSTSLLSKKVSNIEDEFIEKKSSLNFKSKWQNVAFDTFTDVCFFILGAFLFALCVTKGADSKVFVVLIVLGIYLLFASKYWFITKIYQFYARFPYQFRLSQWGFYINEEDKNKVKIFLDSKTNDGNHLLIYGDFGSGKTSLGVGILNELSIKNNSCLYKNGIKMFSAFFNDDKVNDDEIWNWRTTDFLMIDNINPSKPVTNELVSSEKFLSFIDAFQAVNEKNRETIKQKNIIWILGSKQTLGTNNNDQWKEMLLEIGVVENKIAIVNLQN